MCDCDKGQSVSPPAGFDSATPRTAAGQAAPSMGPCRQESWGGLPLPSPGGLPHPGSEAGSPALQRDALPSEAPGIVNMHQMGLPRRRSW